MDIDQVLIEVILASGRLEPFIEAGITSADVESDDARRVFAFVMEHYKNPRYKGTIPTRQIVERKFPDFKIAAKPKEKVEWVIDEIRSRSTYNYITAQMQKIAGAMKKNDLQTAQRLITTGASELASRNAQTKLVSINKNTEERKMRYQQRRDGFNVFGIPTGFKYIDDYTMGWQPGDFVLILGKRGKGKTWFVIKTAQEAQLSGRNVMVVSREMRPKTLQDRYDAIYAKLPYRAFRRGELGKQLEKQYYAKLKEIEQLQAHCYFPEFKGPCTPLTIQAMAREHKVGLVVIDGVYMVQDDGGLTSGWEKHAHVAAGLKEHLCSDDIPVVCTNQLNKTEDQRDATLDESAYSDTYGQYCDVAGKLVQGPDERAAGEMLWQFLKIREEEMPEEPHRMKWDLNEMEFDSISEDEAEGGEKQDAVSY